MSNSNDPRYRDNRHLFYNPPGEKAGVSPEFVYNEVLTRVNSLLEKVEKALSLKRDDSGYQNAAMELRNCSRKIGDTLGHRSENVQPENPTTEPETPSVRSR